jgi:ketosteroid isomerase-like protein
MRLVLRLLALAALIPSISVSAAPTIADLTEEVRRAEVAFAKTMADRDVVAFASFIADDAVFFGETALRGKPAVVAAWARFYEGAKAPFSWSPHSVEVLDSGTLAYSSGPVLDPQGKQIATFNSVWRRGANSQWQVVFDKGCDSCRCK